MRVTNLLVGTATLAVIAAGFVGMLTVERLRTAQARSPLRIVFDGSASGLRKGGPVNFDGVPAGEITSIKLESPRKIVALVMLDNSAPIRKDTAVGIEFQGLTGVAAISLVGGAASAPPVPPDQDGVPMLTADLSEQQSMTDTLHNVDKAIVDNEGAIKDTLLSFETYTASLKSKGQAIDDLIAKAENGLDGFNNAVDKVDRLIPGLADGKASALFERITSIREMADSFRKKSATVMEDARQTLLEVSDAASKMSQKLNPQAATAPSSPAAPRRQGSKPQ
ncbi:MlaD family protein [Bradyrhizobium sp. Tv2a-2]|uniref:MlaD family protein n=1 Tax=Bradyrhizobium sp. Tv2a-2 TaxID=113395 RepID=UPI000411853C|nr:MlaD family protein [Bradyrhizobium sp. Tv2a-2]